MEEKMGKYEMKEGSERERETSGRMIENRGGRKGNNH